MSDIKSILKDDWYKTATLEEMRVALMHIEMNAMDKLYSNLHQAYRDTREECFKNCAKDCKWDNNNQQQSIRCEA